MNTKRPVKSLFLFAAALLLFMTHAVGWLRPAETLVLRFLDPLAARMYASGIFFEESFGKVFIKKDVSTLEKENEFLRSELERIKFQNAQLRVLVEENEELKRQLHFSPPEKFEAKNVRVVSKDYFLPHTLVIDRGSDDGIFEGLGVFASGGIFVGKISGVQSKHSVVTLLTDTSSRSAGAVLSENFVYNGVTRGEHNLNIILEFLPKEAVIETGDTVITSGLEENIPAGFAIGTVEEISNISGSLFQTVRVAPAVDFSDIKFLTVFLPEKV